MSAATSAAEGGLTANEEVSGMNELPIDLRVLIAERDERMRAAGLLPPRNPRRSSFEVLRDVRRARPSHAA